MQPTPYVLKKNLWISIISVDKFGQCEQKQYLKYAIMFIYVYHDSLFGAKIQFKLFKKTV
jgi:hypothetical protein